MKRAATLASLLFRTVAVPEILCPGRSWIALFVRIRIGVLREYVLSGVSKCKSRTVNEKFPVAVLLGSVFT
jgi:hypothetical protein